MFSLLIGNIPLTYTVIGDGIMHVGEGGRPPVIEFCHLLDLKGNTLLDSRDYELTTRCGKIYQLYSNNENMLEDLKEFPLGVRS